MYEQHDGQIPAPSITQDPTSHNPFCLLYMHFGPAPLSTQDGTELEWVLLHGNCRRACREHAVLFGKVSDLKGKYVVWRGTLTVWVTKRGTETCWHGTALDSHWILHCAPLHSTEMSGRMQKRCLYLHTYFWQHRQKYLKNILDLLQKN